MEKIFGLLKHFAEESSAAIWPVSFHMFHIRGCQSQHLRLLDALNAKVSPVFDTEPVLEKAKVALCAGLVMHYCGDIHDKVLCPKVLEHRESRNIRLFLPSCEIDDWVNDLNQLIVQVRHHKSCNSANAEEKVVNQVSFLVDRS